MDFYRIKEEYNKFLQEYEKEKRGVTKVPNINYKDRNKFAFGAVMQVNGMSYLNKEYQFCMDNAQRIQKKAEKIYDMVTTNRKQILTDNSCSFRILEEGYREYIEKHLRDGSE